MEVQGFGFDSDAFSIAEDNRCREKKPSVADVLASCNRCNGSGLSLETSKDGHVLAKKCCCLEGASHNGGDWQRHQALEDKACQISAVEVPNRFFKALTSPCERPDLDEWVESIRDGKCQIPMAFFFGDTGTGKTHAAAGILLDLMLRGECTGLYVPLYVLLNDRQSHLETRYDKDEGEKQRNRRVHRWYVSRVQKVDILVLDEMAQAKLTYDERKFVFGILDQRYAAGKITILISNHCKNPNLSLEFKTLISMVGKRISSRIDSAKHFYFKGQDRRLQEGAISISQEDIESFTVPAKLHTLDKDTHQIMTWLTRNPAFETVSTQERKQLTMVKDGVERDMNRETPTSYTDVWIRGDYLVIDGPKCDHEDKKLYALLLKELAECHGSNQAGLKLETSYSRILKLQGHKDGGDQIERLRRQLDRLNRMSLTFKSSPGMKWSGPLLTEVLQKGQGASASVIVFFSHFMISFYRAHAYTTFSRGLSEKLMGDGSAFYFFFVSHTKEKTLYPVNFEQCKNLLGMPQDIPRKAALRRISNATKYLIAFNVLNSSTRFKNNALHPVAGNAL